jgi:hypothetical protein
MDGQQFDEITIKNKAVVQERQRIIIDSTNTVQSMVEEMHAFGALTSFVDDGRTVVWLAGEGWVIENMDTTYTLALYGLYRKFLEWQND